MVISELLKVIPTYPVEEVKTNAFASKQEDIAEVSVEPPVSTTNADNLATPGTSDVIYMDVDIPSNSPNARIRKRKLHRKVLKNMKAAVMSTHVIANVNKDKVSKLLAQAIRLQDPPDREETFVEMDLNSDQFNRRVGIFKDFQDVIMPDDSHIPMGQSNIPEFNFTINTEITSTIVEEEEEQDTMDTTVTQTQTQTQRERNQNLRKESPV